MQHVPHHISSAGGSPARSRRRVLVPLFAVLLAVGTLQSVAATAHPGPNRLWVHDATVVEGDTGTTTARVKIVLKRKHHYKKVSVGYRTKDGTAVAGSDYVAQSGRVWFPKRAKAATVEIPVLGDTVDEADEYFKVKLVRPFRARIVDRVGIVKILDDDEAAPPPPVLPTLSVGDDTAEEGNPVWFKVSLSAPAPATVTFDYATANGTAEAGKDYTAATGNDVAIAKGEDRVWIKVTTLEDSTDEPNEDLYLNISDVKGATTVDAQGRAVILDDDPTPAPLPTLSISDDTSAPEGSKAELTVTLSAVSGKTVTVDWTTVGGGVTGGATPADFTPASGTLTFMPGETSKKVEVSIVDKDGAEPEEQFYVKLSNASNATISDSLGVVTIPASTT